MEDVKPTPTVKHIVEWLTIGNPINGIIDKGCQLTPLMLAIYNKDKHAVKMLLKLNANPNQTAWINKRTAMHLLAMYYNKAIYKLLCSSKIRLSEKDEKGVFPIHIAAYCNQIELARDMLRSGANVNSIDSFGNTPLHYAVLSNHIDMVKMLVEQHADIKLSNNDFERPVDVAKEKGFNEVYQYINLFHEKKYMEIIFKETEQ